MAKVIKTHRLNMDENCKGLGSTPCVIPSQMAPLINGI